MPSLQKADDRFGIRIEIIEGGKGFFKGVVDEPGQGTVPAYQFTNPRRLLRVGPQSPIRAGMVIKTTGGGIFIVGQLGDSENIFKSFRLFETTGKYTWQKRGKSIDPVTELEMDTGLIDQPSLYGVYEPGTQEAYDRTLKSSFETGRFVTNRAIEIDDIVDGKRVVRVDNVLGVNMANLS